VASIKPLKMSGNELVALLTSVVPKKTLWSSLRVMGLLSDVSDYELISDTFPPSEEVIVRGTQSLIDRGLMKIEGGVPHIESSVEAVGLAFGNPESIITYQSVSDDVEFTSVLIDSASSYRVVIDFIHGSSYEVTLTEKAGSLVDFFAEIVKSVAQSFGTYLVDTTYFLPNGDITSVYAVDTTRAPGDLVGSLSLSEPGCWVITSDLPAVGDSSRVFKFEGEDEEYFVYQRRLDSVSEAIDNIKTRIAAEFSESQTTEV